MTKTSGANRKGSAGRSDKALDHRLRRLRAHAKAPIERMGEGEQMRRSVALDCGWGRLIFAQTYTSNEGIIEALRNEEDNQRDIAFYVRDPHVLLQLAPGETFLDPSHTYRLDLSTYRSSRRQPKGFFIRRLASEADAKAVNAIYAARGMVPVAPEFFWSKRDSRSLTYLVAEEEATGDVIGTVTGVDHHRLFNDPERGASLWCLAVDPQSRHPGIGETLVRRLAEYFQARGAAYLDLSVLHDNEQAIRLYEKLGFQRVPTFTVKRKNPINEKLFVAPIEHYDELNPYARIIVDEARRRGVHIEVTDGAGGFFRLSHGGRSIHCRESLSELTSGVAVSICDDKAVTRRVIEKAGLRVPEQIVAGDEEELEAFLAKHGSVVVKPARGEQGRGVSVGLTNMEDISRAVAKAREVNDRVLVEACFDGQDLRLVVIGGKVVAAAVRRPPSVVGDGRKTLRELIEQQSRRRAAATGGESTIPIDDETQRCLAASGCTLETVPAKGNEVLVRKTANLHTGGSIHDVTDIVHPKLVDAACRAARAIDIPVTGIDLMVKAPSKPDYVFIEANERPGLANHEPQPTAQRFMDLLFPQSRFEEA
ncbi:MULTISPECIES: N-acetylglutaminylglutamine synthetase [Chelativorans]|jgi:GNAT-family acetyltransferase (TIGR03103 family)|uniref:N-acetylglutaminylglutamine synthetase n=1 Tax=Chelativorans TaxID=449972 RepID=UPI00140939AB|nr:MULTISPECIES: N-acetylglutaminylglutamine synthetase [Chelativorans]